MTWDTVADALVDETDASLKLERVLGDVMSAFLVAGGADVVEDSIVDVPASL